MTGFFASIWSQFSAWIGMAGVGVIMAAIAFLSGRSSGKKDEQLKQAKAREAIQDDFDEIDGQPIDPGTSYGNLRERLHHGKGGR